MLNHGLDFFTGIVVKQGDTDIHLFSHRISQYHCESIEYKGGII